MSPRKHPGAILSGLVLGLALGVYVPCAHANVYASNVKINGGTNNLSVVPGTSLSISYILNEPASAGVTVEILSGSTAVRTLNFASGAPGTLRGLNTVTWDGTDGNGQNVPFGNYSVSITAAASGYPGWTMLTDDSNPGNYVWEARGIAVDRNPGSPYYGRIFVGNSVDNTASSPLLGAYVGIQKLNADGSYADEGGFSTGGVAWNPNGDKPWKIRVSDDDQVYVGAFGDEGNNAGDIYRFDGMISTNSMLHVFAPPVDKSLGEWSGFCITGAGTNTVLWGADDLYPDSGGIKKFLIQPDGTFDPSAGTNVVGLGGSPGLSVGPYAVSVDKSGAIYAVQYNQNQGNSVAQVFRFPAYDASTNNGVAETNADWVIGPGDDYCGAKGIAVDPTGTYVAACFWGYFPLTGIYASGNIKILNATTGTVVTNLDLGIAFPTTQPYQPELHMDTDCDWDAVGNLYYLDDWSSCWRAFSPPGANHATTVALPVVQISSPSAPTITSISLSGGNATISFTGATSDSASAFTLLSSGTPNGVYAPATGATVTGTGGAFQATVPTSGAQQFYRIRR